MNTLLFVALVTGDQGNGYGARFPDAPGCVAHGQIMSELLASARQVLTAYLERLEASGDAWPAPTPFERVADEPGAVRMLVDVPVEDPPIRVNVSLGERLVQRLDAAAEARGMTRSGFIAQAVRVSLGETGRGKADKTDFEAFGRRLQDDLNAMGRKINESLGPDSAFTRKMNDLDDYVYDGVRKAADSVSAAMARRRAAKTTSPDAGPDAAGSSAN